MKDRPPELVPWEDLPVHIGAFTPAAPDIVYWTAHGLWFRRDTHPDGTEVERVWYEGAGCWAVLSAY